MEQRSLDLIKQRLGLARSRRQVLGTAAKGTIAGVGAALTGSGLGNGALEGGFTPAARVQNGECPATVCPEVAAPSIRRNVYSLSDGEIASLRRGVAVMKQRPPSDPTSWSFQANLHAVPILTPEPMWCQHQSWFFLPWHRIYLYWFERILRAASGDPSLTLPYWNYSDDLAQRALPRAYGDEFDAAANPNPLFEPRRDPRINNGSLVLSDQTVALDAALDQINFFSDGTLDPIPPSFGGPTITVPETDGPGFGLLELTPHGGVHVDVGGANGFFVHVFAGEGTFEYRCGLHPAETARVEVRANAPPPPPPNLNFYLIEVDPLDADTPFDPPDLQVLPNVPVVWFNLSFELPHSAVADDGEFDTGLLEPPGIMLFPQLAARDPIFWLHHANIDRLWERWLALKDGRANPLGECGWMNQEFTFYREDGSSVSMAAKDVLNMTNCLGYRYDDPLTIYEPDPPAPALASPPTPEVRELAETPADQPIGLGLEPVSVSIELAGDDDAALTDVSAATPVTGAVPSQIILTLEGVSTRGAPGVTYGVYVNTPADAAPDPASDAFVGTISLFGLINPMGHDGDEHGSSQSFNITRAVNGAIGRGDWQSEVVVDFVPQGLVPPGGAVPPPVPDDASAVTGRPQGPWVTIERMTVALTE